jgi:gluconokinase
VDEPLSGLRGEWAERWPALKDIPWFPAVGDGAAANLGSGCTGPDRVALTMGTTGAMRVALDRPIDRVPAGLWVYRVNRRYALLGGATTEGGNIFAWLNEMLELPPNTEAELVKMEPTAHGLTVLPFIAGERAPGWHDHAQASIVGLTLHSQPLDLLRAGLESVAYRFALIHQSIAPQLPEDHQIIASGSGLLSSPAWMQIMADVLNRPLIASAEREATSRGVALLALEALGITGNPPAATDETYYPNAEHHALHQAALQKQVELYNRLIVNPL